MISFRYVIKIIRGLEEEDKQVTVSQEKFEIKLKNYKFFNRKFASNRNRELINAGLIVSDQCLIVYLSFEVERREKFQNLYSIIVYIHNIQ